MPRNPWLLPLVLVGLELILTALDLLWGPGAFMATEERYNARGAIQVACGHISSIWALQYRPSCGGCTAEAILGSGLFRILPPTVLTWKLVPALFHLGVAGLGAALAALVGATLAPIPAARRSSASASASAFLALMLGAPAFYRELALTGFGNHAEVMVFVFGAALCLALAARARGTARLLGIAFAGILAGLGIWFCPTAAFMIPVLGLLSLLGWRRGLPAFFFFIPLGLIPAWLQSRADPAALGNTLTWWRTWDLAPPAELWRWLIVDFFRGGLWPPIELVPASISGPWWLLLLGLAGMGALLSLPRILRGSSSDRLVLLVGPIGLLSLGLAYLIRYDLWQDCLPLRAYDPFNLRYRTPLIPLLFLCAAALPALRKAGRKEPHSLLVPLVIVGVLFRLAGWDPHQGPSALHMGAAPDPTVPTGQPPQRLAGMQGRPGDLIAAQVFLESHEDPLPLCREAHLAELGRRVGLALLGGPRPDLDAWIATADQRFADPDDRAAIAAGLASSLTNDDKAAMGLLEAGAPDLARATREAPP